MLEWLFGKKKEEKPERTVSDWDYIDGEWRTYFVCPVCNRFKREYIQAMGVHQFPAYGCCAKCGAMRSKWTLRSMKLNESGKVVFLDGNGQIQLLNKT